MKNGLNCIFPISRSSFRSRSLDCSPCNPIIARYPVIFVRPDQRLNGFSDFAIPLLAAPCDEARSLPSTPNDLLLVALNTEHEMEWLRATEFEGRDVLPSGCGGQPIRVEFCARRVGRLGNCVLIEERSHDAGGPHLAGFVDDQLHLLRFGPVSGISWRWKPEQDLQRSGICVLRVD